MPFSDVATNAVWLGGLTSKCKAPDVSAVMAGFGNIKAVRLGPAPESGPGADAGGQQAAEVYFASASQATAALIALNAVVVPRLSGDRPLTVQCWQQVPHSGGSPAVPAPSWPHKAKPAKPKPPQKTPPMPGHLAMQQQGQGQQAGHATVWQGRQAVECVNLREPAAAVKLPGIQDLPAALAFFNSCCYRAVPDQENGSAVKWAVLQALLARGLRHLGGATFRQVPTLLTKLGDELVIYRNSDPTVAAEYLAYSSAEGRLTSLIRDFAIPQLVTVTSVPGSSTRQVQLHLGLLATTNSGSSSASASASGSSGNGAGGSFSNGRSGGPGAAQLPAAAKKPPWVEQQYIVSSQPSRHLVVLGVGDKQEAAAICQLARAHGHLQAFLLNRPHGSLTLHFEAQAAAEATAREVAGRALPGFTGSQPLAVQYKHAVPQGEGTGTAPAVALQTGRMVEAAAEGAGAAAAALSDHQYSATQPSCTVRIKKLGPSSNRQLLLALGTRFDPGLLGCNLYLSSRIGYLYFSELAAAVRAVQALRSGDFPPQMQGSEQLVVEYRRLPTTDIQTHTSGSSSERGTGAQAAAGAATWRQEQVSCCARCGARGQDVALRYCSGCRAVQYCGRECQLAAWADTHAGECGQLKALAAVLGEATGGAAGQQVDAAGMQLLAAALRAPKGRQAELLAALLAAAAPPPAAPVPAAGAAEERPAVAAEGAAGEAGTTASTAAAGTEDTAAAGAALSVHVAANGDGGSGLQQNGAEAMPAAGAEFNGNTSGGGGSSLLKPPGDHDAGSELATLAADHLWRCAAEAGSGSSHGPAEHSAAALVAGAAAEEGSGAEPRGEGLGSTHPAAG